MNPKYNVVYKIVLRPKRNLSTSSWTTCSYVLDYKINRWTTPKIGKIFAFSSYANAKSFFSFIRRISSSKITLYRAHAVECKPLKFMSRVALDKPIEDFWNNELPEDRCTTTPLGTVGCSKLMLIKKLL